MLVASLPAAPEIALPLRTRTDVRARGWSGGSGCVGGVAVWCFGPDAEGVDAGRVPVAWKRSTSAPTAMSETARSMASANVVGRDENGLLIGWTCSTDRHGSPS